MANLNLTRFDRDGLELFVDENTGRAYSSIRGTARMVGKHPQTITRWIGGAQIETLEAEVLTGGGLQGVTLLTSEQVFDVALKYCPDLAKKMGAAGANTFICGMAGYQVTISIPSQPKTALQLAREQVKLLEQLEIQSEQIKLLESDNLRQSEAIDELFEYSSIIRIAKFNECDEKAFAWYKLKAASQALGEEIKKVPCPRFGTKNLYSHNAWRLAYSEYRLPETTTLVITTEGICRK
jgi:hypothetical protein